MLDSVKLLLGIKDNESDELLELLIEFAESKLRAYLPQSISTIPYDLEYIVTELTISRFNRLGNEAMSSYSQEGESITYSDDDIKPYLKDIQAWVSNNENKAEGMVVFL